MSYKILIFALFLFLVTHASKYTETKAKVIKHFNFATETIEKESYDQKGKIFKLKEVTRTGNLSLENEMKIEENMEWRMNSISKSMTVTLMDILGYDFDSPIAHYVNFNLHEDFNGKTLRDFMNHMAGIRDLYYYPDLMPILQRKKDVKQTRSDITKLILAQPLKEPSENDIQKSNTWNYSNLSYVILGNIIETNFWDTNLSYEEIIQKIFKAKLNIDIKFEFSDSSEKRISGHYVRTTKIKNTEVLKLWENFLELKPTKVKDVFISDGGFPQFFNPAAGLIGTHETLQKYGQWQARNILRKKRDGTLHNYYYKDISDMNRMGHYTVGWRMSDPDNTKGIELAHEGTNEATFSELRIKIQFDEESNDLPQNNRLLLNSFKKSHKEKEVDNFDQQNQHISVRTHTGNYPMSLLSDDFWDNLDKKMKKETTVSDNENSDLEEDSDTESLYSSRKKYRSENFSNFLIRFRSLFSDEGFKDIDDLFADSDEEDLAEEKSTQGDTSDVETNEETEVKFELENNNNNRQIEIWLNTTKEPWFEELIAKNQFENNVNFTFHDLQFHWKNQNGVMFLNYYKPFVYFIFFTKYFRSALTQETPSNTQ